MPLPPTYNFVVQHGPGVLARLSLNDVPFYTERPSAYDGTSGLASHLLVPGANTLTVEILEAPIAAPGCFVAVAITKDVDPDDRTKTVHEVHWPRLWDPVPERERVLPYAHVSGFEIDGDHPPPPWEGSAPETIPPEGTPELHQAVHGVVSSFRAGDADAFVGAMSSKLDDMPRYYPPSPGLARGPLTRKYESVFTQRWDVAPYEREIYAFHPRQGGRLAWVTRTDGRRALSGSSLDDPLQRIETDLVFVRRKGEWRVIR